MAECIIQLRGGKTLRCPAYPDECAYVRICDKDENELYYWHWDEWEYEPTEVMGAIIGACNEILKDV